MSLNSGSGELTANQEQRENKSELEKKIRCYLSDVENDNSATNNRKREDKKCKNNR